MKNIMLLIDKTDNIIDAVVYSEITTKEEIQNIINDVKAEVEGWDIEDIEERLPKDVEIININDSFFLPRLYY